MKITGGSFGISGKAEWYEQSLYVYAPNKIEYPKSQIVNINTRTTKERKFGLLGFIIGSAILGYILLLLLGLLGIAIAVVTAIAGSFYSKTKYIIEIKFSDGKTLAGECNQYEMEEIVKSVNN